MADARLTISYRFDFSDMIRQLREGADRLEALQNEIATTADDTTPTLDDAPEATPRLVKIDGVLAEGDQDAAREALRQMDADPYGLKAGMILQPYTERGEHKWVFRCWGTDDGCEGLVSLDHTSEAAAQQAQARHVAEDHASADGE